ncbi:YhdP family protein [Faunimonas pinastri]|uniref:YhdP family protein n=1 Tax=Faunimonas pinastri TaxID=1855383 RepID=UPI000B873381|nr:AsmA-like C-terminal domain-containing protein [Faunimonas pinastri]
MLLVLVLCLVGLGVQMTRSEIGFKALNSRLEAALKGSLPPGSDLHVGRSAISYRFDRGLVLDAHDVQLGLPGAVAMRAGTISTVTHLSSLLRGNISFNSVQIDDVALSVPLSGGQMPATAQADLIRQGAQEIGRQIIGGTDQMQKAGLNDVKITNASLTLPVASGQPAVTTKPLVQIREIRWQPLGARRSNLWVQFEPVQGHDWSAMLSNAPTADGGNIVDMNVADMPMAWLAPDMADPKLRPFFDTSFNLEARIELASDGGYRRLHGTLRSGGGQLSFSDKDATGVTGAAVEFDMPPDGSDFLLPQILMETQNGKMEFQGAVHLASEKAPIEVSADLVSGVLPIGRGNQRPLTLTSGGLKGRVDLANQALTITSLDMAAPEGHASITGGATFAGPNPGLSLSITTSELPASTLRAMWPPFVAPKTRVWFDQNVNAATLGPAAVQVKLPWEFLGEAGKDKVLPGYGLTGSVPFRDGSFTALGRLPPLVGAEGTIEFANATATITTADAHINVPDFGTLQADGTVVAIPELGRPDPTAELSLHLAGSAKALAALSDIKPFSVAKDQKIDPRKLTGNSDLELHADIPLTDNGLDNISPEFKLTLKDFSSQTPFQGHAIADADILLEGKADNYSVKGTAKLDGVAATLDLVAGSSVADKSAVSLSLDEAARKKLGLDLGDTIHGPVQASVKQGEGANSPQDISLDLKQATVSLDALGWEKGAGVPAAASFQLSKLPDGSTQIRNISVSGEGFGAKGSASLDGKGKLTDVSLADVSLRQGDDVDVSVKPHGNGYDVKVSGASLDVRGLLRGNGSSVKGGTAKGGASSPDLFLSVKLSSATGLNGAFLRSVSGSAVISNGDVRSAALTGRIPGVASPVNLTIGGPASARRVHLEAGDAGTVFRFLGVYQKIAGGGMTMDFMGSDGLQTGSGDLTLRDFHVINEEALAKAVSSSKTAPQAKLPTSGTMNFSKLRVPFDRSGGTISVQDAYLRGPVLGGTGSGTINLTDSKIAISGTLVPAFGINNIAGSIPILGTILGGGRNEGLVGITYKVYGPLDSPTLAMNPISAIAPGILRRIFDY